jgi:hypothetical protein
MTQPRRFTKPVLTALAEGKILGVRSGTAHRFTGVWMVVVNGRLFVRSWNDKATGWRRAFLEEPRGTIQLLSGREIRVRARTPAGERLLAAVDAAYARKYNTPAATKWVRGLTRGRRRLTTTELVPL